MVLWYVILLILEGLAVGAIARAILPGPDPMNVLETFALGLIGSILGGLIAWVFIGHAVGLVFAVICATALLYVRRRFLEQP